MDTWLTLSSLLDYQKSFSGKGGFYKQVERTITRRHHLNQSMFSKLQRSEKHYEEYYLYFKLRSLKDQDRSKL